MSTAAVRLHMTAPELQLAARSAWSEGLKYDIGRTEEPLGVTEMAGLDSGSAIEVSTNVAPLAEGYYRIVARINSEVELPITIGGHWIVNSSVAEIWLLITASGGEVTADFDPTRMPRGYRQQPGPFVRQSNGGNRPPITTAGVREASFSAQKLESQFVPDSEELASLSGAITFRVLYHNQDSSKHVPLQQARYVLTGCTKESWEFVCAPASWRQLSTGFTDASGYFYQLDCTGIDEYFAEVTTHAVGNSFIVRGGVSQMGGAVSSDCGQSFDLTMPSKHGHVFQNLRKTVEATAVVFGAAGPSVVVGIATCAASNYNKGVDSIAICEGSTFDQISGPYGEFVAAHEYGHAYHEVSLWGDKGMACNPHFLDTNSSLGCAFSEGFATFFAAVTRPDLPNFGYRVAVEGNSWFPGCAYRVTVNTCPGGPSTEGALIEGAVAAFLYDLIDVAGEAHDSIAAPGSYVRDLFRTCQVEEYAFLWRRANGADDLAYCVERAIAPGSYLTPRGLVPTDFAESATEGGGWTSARARSNWTWNLYEKP